MTTNDILSYQGNPDTALGGADSGLAPGVIQFKQAIPAWLNYADKELAFKENLYKQHLADVAADKAARAKDLAFDNSKVHPLDTQDFIKKQNEVRDYAAANATKIYGNPTSPESLQLDKMISGTLGIMNQSAQSYAMDQKYQDFIHAHPELSGDDAKAQYELWRNQTPEQRAQTYINLKPSASLDVTDIYKDIKPTLGINEDEQFTGKSKNNYFETTTGKQVDQEQFYNAINNKYEEGRNKFGVPYKTVAQSQYNQLAQNPPTLAADAISHLVRTPQELASYGLLVAKDANGTVIKTISPNDFSGNGNISGIPAGATLTQLTPDEYTPQQTQKIIQELAPDSKQYFQNMFAPLAKKTVSTGWKGTIFTPTSFSGISAKDQQAAEDRLKLIKQILQGDNSAILAFKSSYYNGNPVTDINYKINKQPLTQDASNPLQLDYALPQKDMKVLNIITKSNGNIADNHDINLTPKNILEINNLLNSTNLKVPDEMIKKAADEGYFKDIQDDGSIMDKPHPINKAYTYNGKNYTQANMEQAAKQSGLTLSQYLKKIGL